MSKWNDDRKKIVKALDKVFLDNGNDEWEYAESYRQLKQDWRERANKRTDKTSKILIDFCDKEEYLFTEITDYQFRITNTVNLKQIDIYPKGMKLNKLNFGGYEKYRTEKLLNIIAKYLS